MNTSPFMMNDTINALIFTDDEGDVWLGKYQGGTVREFRPLSDYEGVYFDLETSKFAFVEIQEGADDQIWIKDICTFEMARGGQSEEDVDPTPVTEMLEELEFPSEETDNMFQMFLTETRKAN